MRNLVPMVVKAKAKQALVVVAKSLLNQKGIGIPVLPWVITFRQLVCSFYASIGFNYGKSKKLFMNTELPQAIVMIIPVNTPDFTFL